LTRSYLINIERKRGNNINAFRQEFNYAGNEFETLRKKVFHLFILTLTSRAWVDGLLFNQARGRKVNQRSEHSDTNWTTCGIKITIRPCVDKI
jgi:hypothetical protein